MATTIRISDQVEQYIKEHGKFGDTHDTVLRRTLSDFKEVTPPSVSQIEFSTLPDEALKDYDEMMVEATRTVNCFAALASNVWCEVLRELDRRKLVRLIDGSYEDFGKARIERLWENALQMISAGGPRKK